jgi:hypothetical protein
MWNAELKNSSKAISISMLYSHSKTLTSFKRRPAIGRNKIPDYSFLLRWAVLFLQKCIICFLYRQIRNPLSLQVDDLLNRGEAPDLKFLEKILT